MWEEKDMKKKVLSLMMIAILTASMTAGCGGDSPDAGAAGDAETSSDAGTAGDAGTADGSAAATDADASNTLTVWCWDPAFNIYAMEEAGKVYQQEHPDFVLNVVETPWADVQTKLTTAATSGDLSTLPDIVLMQDNAFQKNVISYPEAFLDLTSSGVDYSQFASGKVAYSTVDGKNYGVPFDNGAVIACYRTDILDQAGYTIEDLTDIDWDRYIEIGKDVLAQTGKPLLSCQSGESDVIMMMMQSAGSSLFDAEGKPSMAGNDTLVKVMETYAELKSTGVLIEVNDWDQYVGTLTNETVAGTINGCWIMASIQTAADQSGKWGITNMPSLVGVDGATNYSNNGGSSWAVTANCRNTDLAYDFLASTFAGSTAFYETILPSSGALATYAPAAGSTVYNEPSEFFGGETVFAQIVDFSTKTPSNNTGVYYYEARDAIATAITNVVAGADIEAEIQTAQDTVDFQMAQ